MADARDRLWAAAVRRRGKDITDVPEERREAVLALLGEADRRRAEAMLGGASDAR